MRKKCYIYTIHRETCLTPINNNAFLSKKQHKYFVMCENSRTFASSKGTKDVETSKSTDDNRT